MLPTISESGFTIRDATITRIARFEQTAAAADDDNKN